MDPADHPAVGTCLDSFHILSRARDPAPIEDIAAGNIFFVQLADAPLLSLDVLSWSRHHRVFPGEGDLDTVGCMAHLVRAGYDGPVSLEIFNDDFRQADVHRTAVDGLRSLRWLEDQARWALAGERARDTLGLQPLPAVGEPSGHEFVEIRTGRLGETTRLLHQLGFAPDSTENLFCERTADGVPAWLAEFGADEELDTGALVTGVDHINMAQPWQHYDEAVQFCTSVLALEAQAAQDVPGPSGLVRSQVMRSVNGAVRLAAQDRRSQAAHRARREA